MLVDGECGAEFLKVFFKRTCKHCCHTVGVKSLMKPSTVELNELSSKKSLML